MDNDVTSSGFVPLGTARALSKAPSGARIATYGKGRRCLAPDCTTKLAQDNPRDTCSPCTDKLRKFPVVDFDPRDHGDAVHDILAQTIAEQTEIVRRTA